MRCIPVGLRFEPNISLFIVAFTSLVMVALLAQYTIANLIYSLFCPSNAYTILPVCRLILICRAFLPRKHSQSWPSLLGFHLFSIHSSLGSAPLISSSSQPCIICDSRFIALTFFCLVPAHCRRRIDQINKQQQEPSTGLNSNQIKLDWTGLNWTSWNRLDVLTSKQSLS